MVYITTSKQTDRSGSIVSLVFRLLKQSRCLLTQRTMWADGVIVALPVTDDVPGVV